MSSQKAPPQGPTIDQAKRDFKQWRKNKRGKAKIPDELWEAAVSLTSRYSINHVSRELKVNYTDLKNKVQSKEAVCASGFIELELKKSELVESECILEIEKSEGSKLRMHYKGNDTREIIEIGKIFCGELSR